MGNLNVTELFLIVTLLFPLVILAAGLGMLAVYACYMAVRDKASAFMGDGHVHARKTHS